MKHKAKFITRHFPTPKNVSPAVPDLLRLSAQIVSAHLAGSTVPPAGLPRLIRSIHAALAGVEQPGMPDLARPQPAVPIKQSVFPEYVVCLEDGTRLKTLTRYLRLRFGLTPERYRERWGLPDSCPMEAPSFTMDRSARAKRNGLGRKQQPSPKPAPPARKRGRPAKANAAVE